MKIKITELYADTVTYRDSITVEKMDGGLTFLNLRTYARYKGEEFEDDKVYSDSATVSLTKEQALELSAALINHIQLEE
jgi:hypothetical protein